MLKNLIFWSLRLLSIVFMALFLSILIMEVIPKETGFPSSKIRVDHEQVVNIDGICSGVIIYDNLIVTAAHCIRPATSRKVIVYFNDNQVEEFVVKFRGKPASEYDFAILSGDTHDREWISLTPNLPNIFGNIVHLGYSGTFTQWATPGVWIGKACIRLPWDCDYLFSARVIPGDSGGAVISDKYEVIGLAWGSFWPRNVGLAFLVPAFNIIEQLDEMEIKWQ